MTTPAPTPTQDWTTHPLPSGWIAEYDQKQQAWYYVDKNKTPPFVTWEDPREKSVAVAQGATVPAAPAPVAPSALPAGVTGVAPGEQPLPAGWIKVLDQKSGRFFFCNNNVTPGAVTWDDPRTPEIETAPKNPNAPAPSSAAPATPPKPAPPPPPRTDVIPLNVNAPAPPGATTAPPSGKPEKEEKSSGFLKGAAVGAGTAILIFNPIAAVVAGSAAAIGYAAKKMGDSSDDEKEKK